MEAVKAAALVAAAAALLNSAGAADPVLQRSCIESDATRVGLDLRCPGGHVIHVVQSLTAIRAEGDISHCRFPPDCTRSRDGDVTGLFPFCNGKRDCRETVELNSQNFCPNGTGHRYVQIEYECVPDSSILNICADAPVLAGSSNSSSSLYIKSPAFPERYGVIVHQRCTCAVHGEDLTVQLLVVKFSERGGTLSIANDTTEWWRAEGTLELYNRDVPGLAGAGTESVNITFNDNGSGGEQAWLRVRGRTGNISMRCGRDDTLGESTATTTVTTSSVPVKTPTAMTPSSSLTGSVTSPPTGVPDFLSTSVEDVQVASTPVTHGNRSQRPPDATPASSQGSATVTALAVMCGLLCAALIVSVAFNLRRGLCRERDPTYAVPEAPAAEDTRPYTELRIYEDLTPSPELHI